MKYSLTKERKLGGLIWLLFHNLRLIFPNNQKTLKIKELFGIKKGLLISNLIHFLISLRI